MSDDFQTFREASQAFKGIGTRLNLMTGVFSTALLLAIGAFGWLNGKVDTISSAITDIRVSSASQSEQLKGLSEKLTQVVDGVQALPGRLGSQLQGGSSGETRDSLGHKGGSAALDYRASLALYGLNPEVLRDLIKSSPPPAPAVFALTSGDASVIQFLEDAIGGIATNPFMLSFNADQIYNLPDGLKKAKITPASNLQLISTDGSYIRNLQLGLLKSFYPK